MVLDVVLARDSVRLAVGAAAEVLRAGLVAPPPAVSGRRIGTRPGSVGQSQLVQGDLHSDC